jgi:sensor histidine kinase YesM
MKPLNLRRFEIVFLLLASLLYTFANNLPYYSATILSGQNNTPFPDTSFTALHSIAWYTFQTLLSIMVLSFINYYLIRLKYYRRIHKLLKIISIILINVILAYLFFKLSLLIAETLTGFPFGKFIATNYYKWKYIYLTPTSLIIAFILNLIVNKRIYEIDNAKLAEENLSIQLKTLKDQIQPHFFFNTLNTLSSIIRTQDKEEGLNFVDNLALTYRYILENNKLDLIQLKDEIEFTWSFILLLTKRFEKNIHINIEISDALYSTFIPPMTFQLLLENAVKHNEISDSRPLSIHIYDDNENIIVSNQINQKKSKIDGPGIGLSNLNMRYDILTAKKIQIIRSETKFTVKLPLIRTMKKEIK